MGNMPSELDKPLQLPKHLRKELKKVHGRIVRDEALHKVVAGHYIICVGDVVTYTFLKLNLMPNIAIVDYKTKRNAVNYALVEKFGEKVIKAKNPAGTITPELWNAIKNAIKSNVPIRIDVDGEEDLAVIPAVIFAPKGAMVIYGIPNTGLAVIEVTDEDKKSAMHIIEEMEV